MSCSVCQHPDCPAIDQALLARTATLAQLSEKYQLSTSALHRHKQHLHRKMQDVQLRFQDILNQGSLMILNAFLEMVIRLSRTAEAEGNSRLVLQATRQGTAIMKFMHKLGFPLTPDTVHGLLANPDWEAQGCLLPADPKFLLASRQALAQSLASPCPEPGSAEDKAPAAGLAGLTDLAGLNQDQLLYLLMELDPSLGGTKCDAQPAHRDKGGKKAGKTAAADGNIKQNQHDILNEKKAGKFSPEAPNHAKLRPEPFRPPGQPGARLTSPGAPEPNRSWVQDLEEGRLDVNILHAIGAGRPLDLAGPGSGLFSEPGCYLIDEKG